MLSACSFTNICTFVCQTNGRAQLLISRTQHADGATGTLNVAAQRASLYQRQRCCCGPHQIFRRLQGRRPSNDSRRVASRCHTDLWTCTKGTNSEFTGLPFTRRQRGRRNDVARPRSRDQTARAPSSAQAGAISAGADPDGGKNAKTATESARARHNAHATRDAADNRISVTCIFPYIFAHSLAYRSCQDIHRQRNRRCSNRQES